MPFFTINHLFQVQNGDVAVIKCFSPTKIYCRSTPKKIKVINSFQPFICHLEYGAAVKMGFRPIIILEYKILRIKEIFRIGRGCPGKYITIGALQL